MAQQRAMAGAVGGPLSREQKKRACMLARKAWDKAGRPGYDNQAEGLPREMRLTQREALDVWRQDEQRKATGCLHLTCAENRMYPRIMAHFARLAGIAVDARYWEGRTIGDASRIALAKLRSEIGKARDVIDAPESYVATIARSKYKTADWQGLSEKQLWTLVFDIRRGVQKRRAQVSDVPF